MNSAEVLIKFKGDTSDAEKKTSNMTATVNGLAKSFTAGALAAQAVTKAIQVFSSNLDSAITRVDTMNNFPKVMSNLGISAEDSAEVIEDLGKQLQGLPTSLDAAAMAVQRFTSKNGDVKESEKIFLAVNNAILAGGGSANIQAQALEQISQAYAKGKPDMMEWRSMMTAMPAQLKQVAIAMGYTDAAMLGEAVRAKEGEAEFARMMETMMKMNTEGVAGFKSFDEQARNATGGISTSVVNMKTAITRGIANMLNSINKALEQFGGISGVLAKVGKAGEQAFTAIGNAVSKAVPYLINFGKWIKNNEAWIKPLVIMIVTFVATFKTIKTIITIINGVKIAFAALNAIMLANPITLIIAAIAALVAGFIYLWNKCDAFRQFWINMWNGFKKVVGTVVNFVKKNWKTMLLAIVNPFAAVFKLLYDNCEGFRNVVNNVVNAIKNFFVNAGQWFYDTVIKPIMDVVNGILGFVKNVGILLVALVTIPIDYIVKKILLPVARFVWDNVLSPIIEFFRMAFDTVKGVVERIISKIKSVISTIVNFISNNVLKPVINTFTTVFDKIWGIVSKVIDKIKNAFTNVKDFIKSVWDTVSTAVKTTISDVFESIGEIIKTPINAIIDAINKVLQGINKITIPDWVPGLGGKHTNFSTIPKLATGTNYVPEDTLAMIHEGEAVIPKKFNPYANPVNSSTLGAMNGSNTTTINVYANFETDPLGQVVSKIKTFSGGAKNDYNWGSGL